MFDGFMEVLSIKNIHFPNGSGTPIVNVTRSYNPKNEHPIITAYVDASSAYRNAMKNIKDSGMKAAKREFVRNDPFGVKSYMLTALGGSQSTNAATGKT